MEKQVVKHNDTSVLGFAICLFIVLSQSASFIFNRMQAETDDMVCYLAAILLQAVSTLLPYFIINARYGSGAGYRMLRREETAVILPLFLALYFTYYISSYLCSTMFGQSEASTPVIPSDSPDPLLFVLLVIFYVIAPAILEELLFRRAVINAIMPYGKWFSVMISSLLFAMSHWDRARVIPVFVFSFFLSVVYIETDNLVVPTVIHMLNNAFAFAGSYMSSRFDQDASSSVMMTVAVAGFVCFIILAVTLPLGSIFSPDERTVTDKRRFWSYPVVVAFLAYILLLALI